jgi:precorrin-2 methylase
MSAKEDNMLQVKVIGIGPGNPELLTGAAQQALAAMYAPGR